MFLVVYHILIIRLFKLKYSYQDVNNKLLSTPQELFLNNQLNYTKECNEFIDEE